MDNVLLSLSLSQFFFKLKIYKGILLLQDSYDLQ